MRFGEILSRSWRQMWTGGSWGFLATWYLSAFALGIVLTLAFVLLVGGFAAVSGLDASTAESLPAGFGLGIFVFVLLAFLIFIPFGAVFQGGLVYLSNERAMERPVRVGAGWSAGFRHVGALVLVILAVFFAGLGMLLVVGLPFGLVFGLGAAGMSGLENGEIGSITAARCCGGLFYLVWIGIAAMLQSWNEVSARHIVIDGMKAGEALSTSIADIRGQLKMTALFALMLIGIAFVVTLPFTLMSSPFDQLAQSDEAGVALAGSLVSLGISLVSMAVSAALALFQASAWTHFFRSRFGLTTGATAAAAVGIPPLWDAPPVASDMIAGAPLPPSAEPEVLSDAPVVDVAPAVEVTIAPTEVAAEAPAEAPAVEPPAAADDTPPAEEAPPADV